MAGGDALFHEIHHRFYPHVYAYCRRRTGADAVDDAVADTFLIAWRKSDEIPSGDQALPWLYGVAYRVLTHQWRSASRRGRLAEKVASLGVTASGLPEEVVMAGREHHQVLAALGMLKASEQEILRLTLWEELPQAEIGVARDLPTSRSRAA